MTIILCGYKCCGKTTLGKAFANAFQYDFIDTDDLILQSCHAEHKTELSIGNYYQLLGETAFRSQESELIQSISLSKPTVIATGGGALDNKHTVSHLTSLGPIIYLMTDKTTLFKRVTALPTLPRFLDPNRLTDSFDDYIDARKHLYESHADHIIDTQDKTIAELLTALKSIRSCHVQ